MNSSPKDVFIGRFWIEKVTEVSHFSLALVELDKNDLKLVLKMSGLMEGSDIVWLVGPSIFCKNPTIIKKIEKVLIPPCKGLSKSNECNSLLKIKYNGFNGGYIFIKFITKYSFLALFSRKNNLKIISTF